MSLNNLFVYGTLMTGFCNHKQYIAPWANRIIPALINGELYHLPQGYPALLEGEGVIRGELVFLPNIDIIIKSIDDLEDYYGPGGDNMYRREITEVELIETGDKVFAYVYFYCDEKYVRQKGIHVVHGDWRRFIELGI